MKGPGGDARPFFRQRLSRFGTVTLDAVAKPG